MKGGTMKTRHLVAALSSLALTSVSALAGEVQPAPVTIDWDNMNARGDMLTARESDDPTALIGCGVRHFDVGGGSYEFGFCQAKVAGEAITCFTENPGLLQAVHSLGDYSYIQFSWDEVPNLADAVCTRIGSSTQSFYLPKTKSNKGETGETG